MLKEQIKTRKQETTERKKEKERKKKPKKIMTGTKLTLQFIKKK